MQEIGFKELYEVSLKTTYLIEVSGKTIEPGETIALFDNIQIANFQEIKNLSSASGGYDGRSLIIWDETKELRLNLVQGIFSKQQLALMSNAKLIDNPNETAILIHKIERIETNENCEAEMRHLPIGKFFVYDANSGEKLINFVQEGKILKGDQPFQDIVVDYSYNYTGASTTLRIGESLTQGYLSLQGKMRVKDDITGQVKTGIVMIPRLKLMSDLSIRLGSNAVPQVGRLDAIALPVGAKGNKKVMEIIFLDDDIDSDM